MASIELFACVRDLDREIMAGNLQVSPDISSGKIRCTILWNSQSAAMAYNGALTASQADIVVFTHADIYLPAGWFARLATLLDDLTELDPAWAVAGLIGRDATGNYVGRIWDQGIGRIIGVALDSPREVVAIDECVLIVRRNAGLTFDPAVPDFHLHGADLIFEAERAGRSSYVLDLPVIHNSKPVTRIPPGFASAYRYVTKKWRAQLPRYGIVVDLRRGRWMLWFRNLRILYKGTLRRSTLNLVRLDNPGKLATQLGLDGRTPSHPEIAQ